MSEMNNLLDLNKVYMEEVFKPQLGKETKKEAPKSESKPEAKSDGGGKDKKEASSDKRVRQAVYDIRYRARREEIPLAKAYTQYLQNTTMSGPEKSAVKAKLGEELEYVEEQEVTQTKYQVRVKDKNSGKSYTRMATREKINQLRANPNIASVEMTKYGTPYEGEKKKGEQTAKTKAGKGLDPVGREDKDIDNDGDHDKTDKYLLKRRKAIGKAIATRKEETEISEVTKMGIHAPHEVPAGNLKKLVKKAVARVDQDVDGDVDKNDPKSGPYGEFVPTPDGKKRVYTKMAKESFSNWRMELFEVDDKDTNDIPQIKEKKVKNTVKINPELKESIEELGGTLLESIEIDEFDFIIEGVYDELLDEGYEDADIEEAIEHALTEATVTFGHDTEREPRMRDKLKSKAKEYLAKAMVKGYNKARDLKKQAEPAVQRAKTSLKRGIRKAALKVADRMKEEVEQIDEDEYRRMLAKERQAERESEKEFRTKGGIGDKKKGPKLSSTKKSSVAGADYAKSQMGSIKLHDKATKGKHTIGNPFTEEVVDEAVYGGNKPKPEQSKDNRYTVTAADKKGNTLAYQNYKKGDKRYKAADHLGEKMNLAKADMGDVVKDFYKSDAPQFKGKTKEERRKMAIAAKLTAERGGKKLGEQQEEKPVPSASAQPSVDKSALAKKKQLMMKQHMLDKQRLQLQQQGKLPTSHMEEVEYDIEEGMDMKDFKANRRKLKRREASADAKKRGHVGKEWYNSGRTYSPDEAKRMRANMDDEERSTRHRSSVDPEGDDSDYSADKTKNPKKIRKQKAMGEEVLDERRREDKGKPRGPEPSPAFKAVSKMMGAGRLGVQPRGKKKEPGKKPPVAGQYGAPKSPAQKVAAKRAAAQRAKDNMSSRFD